MTFRHEVDYTLSLEERYHDELRAVEKQWNREIAHAVENERLRIAEWIYQEAKTWREYTMREYADLLEEIANNLTNLVLFGGEI
jgi:hypothetical protein